MASSPSPPLLEPVTQRAGQLFIILKKHFKLALRSWKTSLVQILAPVFFIFVLLILQVVPHPAFYSSGIQPAKPIEVIPECIPFGEEYCFSLMYAPVNDTSIQPIIQYIADKSGLEIVPFNPDPTKMKSGSIVACDSVDQIIDFLWTNQNVTQAALDFAPKAEINVPPTEKVFSYNILFNGTCLTPFVPLGTKCPNIRYIIQRSVDEAFISVTTDTDVNIKLARQPFPTITFKSALNDTVSSYGILFFYCGMMFCFVIIIYQIVLEKERQLKQGMKLMGLKSSVYWTGWFIYGTTMTLLETCAMMAAGYASTFAYFWQTNFFVTFLIFFLFGESMLALAFMISTFLNSSKSAISAGMLLFIVGALLQMLLSSPSLLAFVYYDNYWVSTMIYYILIWYPPLNFAKCVEDVTAKSFDYGQYVGTGYSWSDIYSAYQTSDGVVLPPTVQSFYLMIVNALVFFILTWYFENILPGNTGTYQVPWFFITREYWGIPQAEQPPVTGELVRLHEDPQSIDSDVLEEDQQAMDDDMDENTAVRVVRLSKQYRKLPFINSKWDFHAQDKLSFNIAKGTLFCLLGHNGAGKTTTINILTGLFPPSSGNAYIYGRSVLTEMNEIRKNMGVCPQHDILWDEMTAVEHLELYSRLKNVPAEGRKELIADKLEMVKLTKVGNNRVGSYSGGMKRRLSVAISSIGEPNIIFMDEPTTGMDPMSRRYVWELIHELKKDRVIILTTHSMEEADVLADRIGIMAHGKLRCVGNSLHLKSKFGDGYRINIVVTDPFHVVRMKEIVNEHLPTALPIAESGCFLVFGVNTQDPQSLVPFFQYLEEEEQKHDALVRDWGISQTTLEDVFLKVTREVYSGGNRIDGVDVK